MKKISFLFFALAFMVSCSNDEVAGIDSLVDEKKEMQTKNYGEFEAEVLTMDIGGLPAPGMNAFCHDNQSGIWYVVFDEGMTPVVKKYFLDNNSISDVYFPSTHAMGYSLCAGHFGQMYYADDNFFGELDEGGNLSHLDFLFPNQSNHNRYWGLAVDGDESVYIGRTEIYSENGSYVYKHKIYRMLNGVVSEVAIVNESATFMSNSGLFMTQNGILYVIWQGNDGYAEYAKVNTRNGRVEYSPHYIDTYWMASSFGLEYPFFLNGNSICALSSDYYYSDQIGNIPMSVMNETGEMIVVNPNAICTSIFDYPNFYTIAHVMDSEKFCLLNLRRNWW